MIKSSQTSQGKNSLIYLVVVVLIAGIFYYTRSRQVQNFDLNRDAQLSYSRHAKCRMACRHIDKSEVAEVLHEGKVNVRKSRPNEGTVAIESVTHDDQNVRIVVAKKSENKLHVVTVIDLDTEWPCHCN